MKGIPRLQPWGGCQRNALSGQGSTGAAAVAILTPGNKGKATPPAPFAGRRALQTRRGGGGGGKEGGKHQPRRSAADMRYASWSSVRAGSSAWSDGPASSTDTLPVHPPGRPWFQPYENM